METKMEFLTPALGMAQAFIWGAEPVDGSFFLSPWLPNKIFFLNKKQQKNLFYLKKKIMNKH